MVSVLDPAAPVAVLLPDCCCCAAAGACAAADSSRLEPAALSAHRRVARVRSAGRSYMCIAAARRPSSNSCRLIYASETL